MQVSSLIKIAITGPESTGKSQLSAQLARHFQTVFVPEFARYYLPELARPYEAHDLLSIARGQLVMEKALESQANTLLFLDTEMLVIKVWHEHAYHSCPEWISQRLAQQAYDLYLLMDIDLPWQADPLREHPHLRTYFFEKYRQLLEASAFPYQIISGQGPARFDQAFEAITQQFPHTKPPNSYKVRKKKNAGLAFQDCFNSLKISLFYANWRL
ncbi:MAG: ATP-binding protein [Microscillaceae bacterium]|nr:ATP-binding protein [Microscillaceae bacterium]